MSIAVLGAGLAGCGVALELANRGQHVVLFDRRSTPMQEASRWCEGKIHLGLVYANDPSFKTARTMIDGALAFARTLERWVDLKDRSRLLSDPFEYAVLGDSMLPVEQIEEHFAKVETFTRQRMALTGNSYLADLSGPMFERADVASGGFDPGQVVALFRTAERAIDTALLADLLCAAVVAHPRIERVMDVDVRKVMPSREKFHVVYQEGGAGRSQGPFRHVVNALWANRAVIDAGMGLVPNPRVRNRLKLGVNISNGAQGAGVSSTTFVLGPYGDFVRFPSGRLYLSWYPAGMFETRETLVPVDWRERLASVNHEQVINDTMAALQRLTPGLDVSIGDPAVEVVVEGGAIFALGATDIDDFNSELHQRFNIGAECRGGYVSLNTGKLTTAPLFALQVADLVCPAAKTVDLHSA
jgi:hypothetical protein